MKSVRLVVFFLFSWSGLLFSQEDASKPLSDYISLRGYVKNMQVFQFADPDYILHSNLVHNRLNFRFYPSPKITGALEVRNRLFTGEQVNVNPAYASSVDHDDGIVDLSWAALDGPGVVLLSQIDRAWLRYATSSWEVTIGRQRINWGLNTFWNSNDLFNTFSLVDFDYEERPGSDGLRVQHFFRDRSFIDVAMQPADNDSTWIGALRYGFNKGTYDFQFIGGWWNQDIAIGAGWAGNIRTAGFKGEATYFHPRENLQDTSGTISFSTSVDYVFKGGIYAMAGFLYQSQGVDTAFSLAQLQNAALFSTEPPSAKNLMPSKYSLLLNLSAPVTPLITASAVGLYSPGLNAVFLMPSVAVSVANNWEFAVFGQSSFLDAGGFRNFGNAVFARLKWGF